LRVTSCEPGRHASLPWLRGCCSTVSSCGRARRAASAALGQFGEVRFGLRTRLIKNMRPCNLMAPPRTSRTLASPLRYRQVTASPLLFLSDTMDAPRRRRTIANLRRARSSPLPCSLDHSLDRLLPLGCITVRKSLVCWGVDRAARYQLACALVVQLPWSRPCGKSLVASAAWVQRFSEHTPAQRLPQ
jgi:hypothetical protein